MFTHIYFQRLIFSKLKKKITNIDIHRVEVLESVLSNAYTSDQINEHRNLIDCRRELHRWCFLSEKFHLSDIWKEKEIFAYT